MIADSYLNVEIRVRRHLCKLSDKSHVPSDVYSYRLRPFLTACHKGILLLLFDSEALSIYLSVCLSIYLSVYLSISIYIYIYICIYKHTHTVYAHVRAGACPRGLGPASARSSCSAPAFEGATTNKYIYIYIYIYRERERERDICI